MSFSSAGRSTKQPSGFTLLELMIVLAVIAVLLTLAVPSYQQYIQRAHRAEVIRAMFSMADCQSRIKANLGFYDTSKCLEGLSSNSYDLWLEPTANERSAIFTIIAKPKRSEGEQCGTLSLNQAGTQAISGGAKFLERCWSGR